MAASSLTRALTLAIALTIAASMTGCNSNQEIRLTERDDGRSVTLQKNQLLTITLTSPVLPWRWEVTQSQEGIVERALSEEQRSASPPPQGSPVGGSSNTTFVFKGIGPGQVTLTFVARRPDPEDGEPKGGFKVQVSVQ